MSMEYSLTEKGRKNYAKLITLLLKTFNSVTRPSHSKLFPSRHKDEKIRFHEAFLDNKNKKVKRKKNPEKMKISQKWQKQKRTNSRGLISF